MRCRLDQSIRLDPSSATACLIRSTSPALFASTPNALLVVVVVAVVWLGVLVVVVASAIKLYPSYILYNIIL